MIAQAGGPVPTFVKTLWPFWGLHPWVFGKMPQPREAVAEWNLRNTFPYYCKTSVLSDAGSHGYPVSQKANTDPCAFTLMSTLVLLDIWKDGAQVL